jgi:hypothetical protein
MARPDLTDGAKLVLFAMASHLRDEGGTCWPSIDRLAAMTGRSRRGTHNAIDVLEAAGLVEVERRQDDSGRSDSHLFRLVMREDAEVAPRDASYDRERMQNLHPNKTSTEIDKGNESPRRKTSLFTASADDLREVWNTHRGQLPEWKVMGPAQRQAAIARLRELPLERWPEVVRVIASSPFCIEKRLGVSFLLKAGTWPRVLNGEIAGWGAPSSGLNGHASQTPAQGVKRRIERSSTDDHLAAALGFEEVEP